MNTAYLSEFRQHGFTMVELVLVIVIAGLLASVAVPRFFNQDSFSNRGFYTEVLNAVRYAQQLAVATNCSTEVTLNNNSFSVMIDNDGANCDMPAFTLPAPNPVTGQPGFTGNNPTVNITPAPTTLSFDALGTANIDIDITVGGVYTFRVHQATGYIEERQ